MSIYKIKDLETLSGVKAHTIRIWEKRYNILSPERTVSKIRAYNNDELTHLLNLSMLNKNGYKISALSLLSCDEISQLVWKLRKDITVDGSQENLIAALINLDEELFRNTLGKLIETIGLEKKAEWIRLPMRSFVLRFKMPSPKICQRIISMRLLKGRLKKILPLSQK